LFKIILRDKKQKPLSKLNGFVTTLTHGQVVIIKKVDSGSTIKTFVSSKPKVENNTNI